MSGRGMSEEELEVLAEYLERVQDFRESLKELGIDAKVYLKIELGVHEKPIKP